MVCDVLYDGGCGVCTRSVIWLRRFDRSHRLRFRDITREWDTLSRKHPSLDAGACAAAMHVIEASGRITTGFDGFRTIARAVVRLWPLLPFLYVPGVPFVGRRVYAAVASHRTTTCALPRPHVP